MYNDRMKICYHRQFHPDPSGCKRPNPSRDRRCRSAHLRRWGAHFHPLQSRLFPSADFSRFSAFRVGRGVLCGSQPRQRTRGLLLVHRYGPHLEGLQRGTRFAGGRCPDDTSLIHRHGGVSGDRSCCDGLGVAFGRIGTVVREVAVTV